MQAMGIEAGAQQAPPNPLAVLTGTPGTRSDIAVRVVQIVSAIFAVVAMVSANDFSTVSAFRYVGPCLYPPTIRLSCSSPPFCFHNVYES
jgi:hypothetical protein